MWRLSLKQQDCQKTQLRIYKSKGKILQAAFATKADAAFCFSPIGNRLRGKISLAQVYAKYRYSDFALFSPKMLFATSSRRGEQTGKLPAAGLRCNWRRSYIPPVVLTENGSRKNYDPPIYGADADSIAPSD